LEFVASPCGTGTHYTCIALGVLVAENLPLSLEMVQQIVTETRAERELSQSEIEQLAFWLNDILSEYLYREELYSEPTFSQLINQINKLHTALKELKLALTSPEQISLRNYLIELGEEYASTKGQHPNLAPCIIGCMFEGEEVSAVYHYRSDERLEEMINSVLQFLEWMDHTPAKMKEPSNWWDRNPHWFEGEHEKWLERETKPYFTRIDAHRRRATEYLIGTRLPQFYELTFRTKFGVSRPPGPGVRFVLVVLKHAQIFNDDNQPFSIETVIKYRQNYLRRARQNYQRRARGAGTSSSPSVLEEEGKKTSRSSNDG
jgi:hypothetical protein